MPKIQTHSGKLQFREPLERIPPQENSQKDLSDLSLFILHTLASGTAQTPPTRAQLLPSTLIQNYPVRTSTALMALYKNLSQGKGFQEAYDSLGPTGRRELISSIGKHPFQKLLFFSKLEDPLLYGHEALNLARSLLARGSMRERRAAAAILGRLAEEKGFPIAIRKEAKQELDGMLGRGAFGGQFEALLPRVQDQALDWKLIAPMVLASPVYRLGKIWTLGKMAKGPSARLVSSAVGLGGETVFFSLGSRSLISLTERNVPWDVKSVVTDLLGTGLTLGLLRGTGWLFQRSYLGIRGLNPSSMGLSHADQVGLALQGQLGAYFGLVAAQELETRVGLRPGLEGRNPWLDALGTHLALQLGSHGGRRLLGQGYTTVERQLSLQTYLSGTDHGRETRPWEPPKWLTDSLETPRYAPLGGVPKEKPWKEWGPNRTQPLLMATSQKGTEGKPPSSPDIFKDLSLLKVARSIKHLSKNFDQLSPREQKKFLKIFSKLFSEPKVTSPESLQDLLRTPRKIVDQLWERRQDPATLSLLKKLPRGLPEKIKLPPPLAKEEKGLWQAYFKGPLREGFNVLSELNALYMRNFARGGTMGTMWVRKHQDNLSQRVQEEGLHSVFIQIQADGTHFMDLPPAMDKPSYLKLPDGSPRPRIIHLAGQDTSRLSYLAYLHIPDLVLIQHLVSKSDLEVKKGLVSKGIHWNKPVVLSHDGGRDAFILDNGYHRTMAAHQKGYPYILGVVLYHYTLPLSRRTLSLDELKIVPHEEFVKYMEKANENMWPLK